jgi:hypothetical protein
MSRPDRSAYDAVGGDGLVAGIGAGISRLRLRDRVQAVVLADDYGHVGAGSAV